MAFSMDSRPDSVALGFPLALVATRLVLEAFSLALGVALAAFFFFLEVVPPAKFGIAPEALEYTNKRGKAKFYEFIT